MAKAKKKGPKRPETQDHGYASVVITLLFVRDGKSVEFRFSARFNNNPADYEPEIKDQMFSLGITKCSAHFDEFTFNYSSSYPDPRPVLPKIPDRLVQIR